jgi:hypothetical protein
MDLLLQPPDRRWIDAEMYERWQKFTSRLIPALPSLADDISLLF